MKRPEKFDEFMCFIVSHLGIWDEDTLPSALRANGFDVKECFEWLKIIMGIEEHFE